MQGGEERKKTERIIADVKAYTPLGWDEKGRLVHRGRVIEGASLPKIVGHHIALVEKKPKATKKKKPKATKEEAKGYRVENFWRVSSGHNSNTHVHQTKQAKATKTIRFGLGNVLKWKLIMTQVNRGVTEALTLCTKRWNAKASPSHTSKPQNSSRNKTLARCTNPYDAAFLVEKRIREA